MNNDLSKLVEAVRAAHADIAPTYAEYVQLALSLIHIYYPYLH